MHKHLIYLNSLSNPLQNVSYIYVNCMWLWKAENTRWKKNQKFQWMACCSVTRLCLTFCNLTDGSTLGFPVLHYLLEFAQNHVHGVGDAIQRAHPLSTLLLLPSVFPSIRVFPSESAFHIRWPKYWSFSLSICPSNEHPGLISFRMDWLDLLAVQGTLKSLLQHHSSKSSILQCSAFFIVQLSYPYMTTFMHDYWKTHSFYFD